jgi:hypothetical protein
LIFVICAKNKEGDTDENGDDAEERPEEEWIAEQRPNGAEISWVAYESIGPCCANLFCSNGFLLTVSQNT